MDLSMDLCEENISAEATSEEKGYHSSSNQKQRINSCTNSFIKILFSFFIIATFLHISHSAPAAPYSKFKSPREKGCYYLLKHYENGQEIETNEPCLNCTCLNSMLMCYLRVCPYVRPLGDRCIIERIPGECCPRITCPDSTEATTPEPETSDGSGCYVEGEHYKEGAQIPSDPEKPCEVCYCIRNTSSCVVQECTLKVAGCQPLFSSDSCCPTRYNCSEEAATTVPPGLLHPSSPQLGCRANGKNYLDGEAVPSRDACEHCYCMKNEIVCAVQECKAPCEGCVAIPSDTDQCCPERYECAAPTRVTNSSNVYEPPTSTTHSATVKSALESVPTPSGLIVKSESTTVEPEATTKPQVPESRVVLIPSQPRRDEPGQSRRRPFPSVGVIPGEGICRHEGKVYQNGDEVLSKNPCVEYCMCINSVVYCDETVCTEPKVRDGNCTRVKLPTDCCPRYECVPLTTTTTTTTTTTMPSTLSPSATISTIDTTTKGFTDLGSSSAEPVAEISVSPELSSEASSELSSEASPELSSEASPELSSEASPELSSEATPELSSEASPELSSETSSELSSEASSELSSEASSELSSEASPELSSETSPPEQPSTETPFFPTKASNNFEEKVPTTISNLSNGDEVTVRPGISATSIPSDSSESSNLPELDIEEAATTTIPAVDMKPEVARESETTTIKSTSALDVDDDNISIKQQQDITTTWAGLVSSTSSSPEVSAATLKTTSFSEVKKVPEDVDEVVNEISDEKTLVADDQEPATTALPQEINEIIKKVEGESTVVATEKPKLASISASESSKMDTEEPETVTAPIVPTQEPEVDPMSDFQETTTSVMGITKETSFSVKESASQTPTTIFEIPPETTTSGYFDSSTPTLPLVSSLSTSKSPGKMESDAIPIIPTDYPEISIDLETTTESQKTTTEITSQTPTITMKITRPSGEEFVSIKFEENVPSQVPVEETTTEGTSFRDIPVTIVTTTKESVESTTGSQPTELSIELDVTTSSEKTEPLNIVSITLPRRSESNISAASPSPTTESSKIPTTSAEVLTFESSETTTSKEIYKEIEDILRPSPSSLVIFEELATTSTTHSPTFLPTVTNHTEFKEESLLSTVIPPVELDVEDIVTTVADVANGKVIGSISTQFVPVTTEQYKIEVSTDSPKLASEKLVEPKITESSDPTTTTISIDEVIGKLTRLSNTTLPPKDQEKDSKTGESQDVPSQTTPQFEDPVTMATVAKTGNPVTLKVSPNSTADFLLKEVTQSPLTTTTSPIGNEQFSDNGSSNLVDDDQGSCVFEGKVFQSAEQIPRPHPCDFCFCFRGDIICLQQTCPPPIPRCYETPIQGFCCPRYECPVQSTSSSNATTPRSVDSPKGCQVNGTFYEIGDRVQQASGPCLECKCDHSGLMQCDPQTCSPPAPLLLRMNRDFFASTIRR